MFCAFNLITISNSYSFYSPHSLIRWDSQKLFSKKECHVFGLGWLFGCLSPEDLPWESAEPVIYERGSFQWLWSATSIKDRWNSLGKGEEEKVRKKEWDIYREELRDWGRRVLGDLPFVDPVLTHILTLVWVLTPHRMDFPSSLQLFAMKSKNSNP